MLQPTSSNTPPSTPDDIVSGPPSNGYQSRLTNPANVTDDIAKREEAIKEGVPRSNPSHQVPPRPSEVSGIFFEDRLRKGGIGSAADTSELSATHSSGMQISAVSTLHSSSGGVLEVDKECGDDENPTPSKGWNKLCQYMPDDVSPCLDNTEANPPLLALTEVKSSSKNNLESLGLRFELAHTTAISPTRTPAENNEHSLALVNSKEAEEIIRRAREKKNAEKAAREQEEARRAPFRELYKAAEPFLAWSPQLEDEIHGRRPTHEERADRFLGLATNIRGVVDRHGFHDFWELSDFSRSGKDLDQVKLDEFHLFRHLLCGDVSRDDFIRFDQEKLPIWFEVLVTMTSRLPELANYYQRLRNAPSVLTLDDLIGLLNSAANGKNLLSQIRPEVAEVRDLFARVYDDFSFDRDWLNCFANGYDKDYPPPYPPARSLALSDLIERLKGWEEADRNMIEHPPQSANLMSDHATEAVREIEKPVGTGIADHDALSLQRLLRVLSNGVSDKKIQRAVKLIGTTYLTVEQKLEQLSKFMPFLQTASGPEIAKMLGVSKQAVNKSDWWGANRAGERDEETGHRRARLESKGKHYETTSTDEDDD